MRQPLCRTLTLLLATALTPPLHAEEKVDSGAYLAARIAYVPAYALGLRPWRSAIWGVGFFATLTLLLAALI